MKRPDIISLIMSSQLMKFVFGQGAVGHMITGMIRIPAMMSSLVAIMIAGELAIRLLRLLLSCVGYEVRRGTWIERLANFATVSVRPYGDDFLHPTSRLLQQGLLLMLFSILSVEAVAVLGGPAPAIYNWVLSAISPCWRITTESYFTSGLNHYLRVHGLM